MYDLGPGALLLLIGGAVLVALVFTVGAPRFIESRTRARDARARKLRHRAYIVHRFGEADASRILRGEVWTGATLEMMSESLGKPRTATHRTTDPLGDAVFLFEGPDGARPVEVTFRGGQVVAWRELDD